MNSIKSTFMVKANKTWWFAIILLISIYNVNAQQDTVFLSLDDALMIARSQSADALIAKQQFRMNYWQYRSFKADYLPSVTLDAAIPNFAQGFTKISVEGETNKYQYTTDVYYDVGLSINQKVGLTGGSLFLRSDLSRSDNIVDSNLSITYQSYPIIVGYTQPIFQYNEYRWAKKLEPLKYEKAKRQYLEDVEQVSINTVNHFFNLLLAQVEMRIAEKNLNNYDTLFKVAKGRYQLGKIAENDLLQLELNYLRAKAAVDNARLSYEDMLFRLKSYLRLKSNSPIKLIPPANTWHDVISTSDALAEARKNTAASLEFQERLITAESNVRRAKMDGRLDADLSLQYRLTQNTSELENVYKDPNNGQILDFGITVPILDWGKAKGQINVAESGFELEQTSVEQEVIDFEQNVFLNVMEFNMQKDQLYIAAKGDTVAQKRYDVTQKRYMIGQVNDVLELNNAQIDNDTAKKGYFSALRSYWINYYQLRKMTLYDFNGKKMLIFDIRDIL
jgi:outer membrane protein